MNLDGFVCDAGGHFGGEEFGDGGVHAEAGVALEMTEGEMRSLHSAPTKDVGATVGMTDFGGDAG